MSRFSESVAPLRITAAISMPTPNPTNLSGSTVVLSPNQTLVGGTCNNISLPFRTSQGGSVGVLAGGLLCTFADVAMGVALATVLDGEPISTIHQQIEHLRPTVDSRLTATAEVVHRGRRVAHMRCSIFDAADDLVAEASSIWMIAQPSTTRTGEPSR